VAARLLIISFDALFDHVANGRTDVRHSGNNHAGMSLYTCRRATRRPGSLRKHLLQLPRLPPSLRYRPRRSAPFPLPRNTSNNLAAAAARRGHCGSANDGKHARSQINSTATSIVQRRSVASH